jgi:hypothetical protein
MASLYSSVRKRLVSLAMTVSIFAQNMTDLGIAGQLKTCRRSAEQSPRGFEALLANHVASTIAQLEINVGTFGRLRAHKVGR